ncbi:shikimate kinase [Dactylosporangium sp. NPDC005555]|uniref:shikimate kinase n=1 Tax=Dactylosporangium sp. NPDC005555 TaxID=3154889 RepID=UPI0033A9F3A0
MRRVSVVGNSGSGKSTLGRALAARLGVPFVELDAIHHLADWEPIEATEFRRTVGELADGDGWVIDGNYSAVRDLIWARADTVVWFDLPRRTVIRQLLWRTIRRGVTREPLWNGNHETLGSLFRLDPQKSLLRWAWTRHRVYHERYTTASAERGDLTFIRITSRQDAARLLG